MLFFHRLTGTALGIGFLPKAPGTWASLATAAAVYFFTPEPSSLLRNGVFLVIIAAVFALGVWSGTVLERIYGHDPSCVVIDEVAGMAITLWLVPMSPASVLTGLILFRLFDITKWLGAEAMQKLRGGWGIMLDDVVAGIWANIFLQISVRLVS